MIRLLGIDGTSIQTVVAPVRRAMEAGARARILLDPPASQRVRPHNIIARGVRIVPALLRFTGAVERAPAIDKWLDAQPSELGSIARTWFALIRQCGADVRELMHDGYATACVQDAPFAYVGVFRDHVNVGFFHGAALPDPAGLLQGTGKDMRHVKVKPGLALDRSSLEALIASAYQDIVTRLG